MICGSLFSFYLGYSIKNDQENHDGLKTTYQLPLYSEEVKCIGLKNTEYYKTAEFVLVTIKQICLGQNVENIKYMIISRGQNLGSNLKAKTDNKSIESVAEIKFWKQQSRIKNLFINK
jgi:hypothetical protein